MKISHVKIPIIFILLISLNAYSSGQKTVLEKEFFEQTPDGFRVCCAFGYNFKYPIFGYLGIGQDNRVDLEELKSGHNYSGSLGESDGQAYSCKAGFIDSGHLREAADWTAYVATQIKKKLGKQQRNPDYIEINLSNQATDKIVAQILTKDKFLSDETIIRIAQRIAMEYLTWHEVVTWHEWRTNTLFSEKNSSFSPEDLYSNLLGITIGGLALRSYDSTYNEAMDKEIYKMALNLDIRSKVETKTAFEFIDHLWIDPDKIVTDPLRVLKRNIIYSNPVAPWLVKDINTCKGKSPTKLRLPENDEFGTPLPLHYSLTYHLNHDELEDAKSKILKKEKQIKSWQIPALIDEVRELIIHELGPDALKPY